jgi:hypothetical protein
MKKSDRALWIALCVSAIIGVFWQFTPLPDAGERIGSLPLRGISFSGMDIPLQPIEESFLKQANLIKRKYTIGNKNFFVTVLDGTNNRHIVHDPYYCFRGSGWEILSVDEMALPKGTGNRLTVQKGGLKREALFWFSDGSAQYNSSLRYWWQTALRRVTLGLSGQEPVLIVIQPLEDSKPDWADFVQDFPNLMKL